MYDCAVVGGGAAGLLAAMTLSEAGREVILLEARDYLGGRAHSVPLSDGTVVAVSYTHQTLPTTPYV